MKDKLLNSISNLKSKALTEEHFSLLDTIINEIAESYKKGIITLEDITEINKSFGNDFLKNTIQGHSFLKPYGYAGDFLMIDKIYTKTVSNKKEFVIWDKYAHQTSATIAVRNRKTFFKEKMHQKIKNDGILNLLNVASGPARDLFELYSEINSASLLKTTCVDMDENAVKYASELNKQFLDSITFIKKNIFRFQTDDKFDIIWSAGLFDYFDERAFVLLLKRFKTWLKPKGDIIIGNFNENNNPSRNFMELFGEWTLNHRSEEQLIELAKKAGFLENQISIDRESENVNLFLRISQ